MEVQDIFNYDNMEFGSRYYKGDFDNKFITEEMLLLPLYKKIPIDKDIKTYSFFPINVKTECYCKECNQRRIFSFFNSEMAINSFFIDDSSKKNLVENLKNVDFFTFYARADCQHKMLINFMKLDDNTIMKIGQFPSPYELNDKINNKKFLKILSEEYAGYYKNACSLYSYNNCIGALTYLRRIFEKLLIDVFNDNKKELKIELDDYKKLRMEDKITTIKDYLPSIMQEQGFNKIYTKISGGIHNLSEKECSSIFLVLKEGIEEILIERLENKERIKRREKLSTDLNEI